MKFILASFDKSNLPGEKASETPLTLSELNNLSLSRRFIPGTLYLMIGDDGSKHPIWRYNARFWEPWEPDLSLEQSEAYKDAMDGRNLFITGPGGNGKTHVARRIIKDMREAGRVVAVTATTGVAAIQAGGMTIHSFAGTGIAKNIVEARRGMSVEKVDRTRYRLSKVQTVFLDEIGMCTGDQLDMIDQWFQFILQKKKPFGGMQMIFLGDLLQLPPVVLDADANKLDKKYVFQAKVWESAAIKVHQLTYGFRQGDDNELKSHLSKIRYGACPPETLKYFNSRVKAPLEEKDPTKIYPLRADVDAANEAHLAALPGEAFAYTPIFSGNPKWIEQLRKNLPCEEVLVACENAKVIFTKNNLKDGYANGTRGIVTDIGEDHVVVRTKYAEVNVTRAVWESKDETGKVLADVSQYPFRLAAACTVHKSQGQTLDYVEFDPTKIFERGQTYVALSRVTKLSGLTLTAPLQEKHVRASSLCVKFYKSLEAK